MADRDSEYLRELKTLWERSDEACREAEDVRTRVGQSMTRRPIYPEPPPVPGGTSESLDNDQSV